MSDTAALAALNAQIAAASALYSSIGALTGATAGQLSALLTAFQTALGTAQNLRSAVDASVALGGIFDDSLFVSGADPNTMAASLFRLQGIASNLVFIDDIVSRVSRTVAAIRLAQQGQT
jgi:hypothetical protein